MDQIAQEVKGALDFMTYIYSLFGFEYTMVLSTKPKKAMGTAEQWNAAETALKDALNESGKNWVLNPGDGAFYGPKIDVHIRDSLRRKHQCATVQLDFQLPLRFNLQYRTEANEQGEDDEGTEKTVERSVEKPVEPNVETPGEFVEGHLRAGYERPVIIHRAILGSVERFVGVLTENYGGKWPFWLSPRQIAVLPIANKYNEYAEYVHSQLEAFKFYSVCDKSSVTFKKKIRTAQLDQFNYMAVVGEIEETNLTVNLRGREQADSIGIFTLPELMDKLMEESNPSSKPFNVFAPYKGKSPVVKTNTEPPNLQAKGAELVADRAAGPSQASASLKQRQVTKQGVDS